MPRLGKLKCSIIFPNNHLYALKSGWKSLLKKLTQCEITIDELAHCAFSNAQRFIAHLILGYKDCYTISDNGDSTDSEKKGIELDFEDGVKFDRDKFIASSCVCSSNHSSSVLKQVGARSDCRKLLTECQYFEQFIDANRRILRSSSGRQKSENEHYKQFDLVYNWVLRTESEKRNPAAKLGDNFHFKVDTAYSKPTSQKADITQGGKWFFFVESSCTFGLRPGELPAKKTCKMEPVLSTNF